MTASFSQQRCFLAAKFNPLDWFVSNLPRNQIRPPRFVNDLLHKQSIHDPVKIHRLTSPQTGLFRLHPCRPTTFKKIAARHRSCKQTTCINKSNEVLIFFNSIRPPRWFVIDFPHKQMRLPCLVNDVPDAKFDHNDSSSFLNNAR